jgi:GH35 family endo-1,4-beta-xylanase
VKYAKELGVDWQANFIALLDDMQIRNYRLMSYWDMVEPTRGTFNFSELDWQMDEAGKRGAKVSLAIGMRQPRWPECHKPKWYSQLSKTERNQAIFDFNTAVVDRYKDHPALQSYQLEK